MQPLAVFADTFDGTLVGWMHQSEGAGGGEMYIMLMLITTTHT
jgi:hypothetical protein